MFLRFEEEAKQAAIPTLDLKSGMRVVRVSMGAGRDGDWINLFDTVSSGSRDCFLQVTVQNVLKPEEPPYLYKHGYLASGYFFTPDTYKRLVSERLIIWSSMNLLEGCQYDAVKEAIAA